MSTKATTAPMVEISDLVFRSCEEVLADYANGLPDGKAVALQDAAEEIQMKRNRVEIYAKKLGVVFSAVQEVKGLTRRKNFIANPKTVRLWLEAQKARK